MNAQETAGKAKESLKRITAWIKKNPAAAALIAGVFGVIVYLLTRNSGGTMEASPFIGEAAAAKAEPESIESLIGGLSGSGSAGASPIVDTQPTPATPIPTPSSDFGFSDPGLGSFSDMSFSSLDPMTWQADYSVPAAAAAAPSPAAIKSIDKLAPIATKTGAATVAAKSPAQAATPVAKAINQIMTKSAGAGIKVSTLTQPKPAPKPAASPISVKSGAGAVASKPAASAYRGVIPGYRWDGTRYIPILQSSITKKAR